MRLYRAAARLRRNTIRNKVTPFYPTRSCWCDFCGGGTWRRTVPADPRQPSEPVRQIYAVYGEMVVFRQKRLQHGPDLGYFLHTRTAPAGTILKDQLRDHPHVTWRPEVGLFLRNWVHNCCVLTERQNPPIRIKVHTSVVCRDDQRRASGL